MKAEQAKLAARDEIDRAESKIRTLERENLNFDDKIALENHSIVIFQKQIASREDDIAKEQAFLDSIAKKKEEKA